MANDNILRLRVDSKEYDSKIERARQGLLHLEQSLQKVGKSFADVDKDQIEYVRSLSEMETVATTSKAKLREMTQSLVDLTSIYRRLSDEEKKSPFGQALSQSIDNLTERAGQAKDAMGDVQASITNAASDTRAFDQISQGIGLMTNGFQTATGAAKLLGFELGDNVEVIAKLQAAMAVTSGLQQAQNTLQKESALLQGVMAVQTKAATAAIALEGKTTKLATAAQAAFNVVAKANPYILLATAAASVVAAYLAWSKTSKKAEDSQKSLNAEINSTKSQLSNLGKDVDFNVSIAEASGKSWKAIHELRLEAARAKLALADLSYDKVRAGGGSKEQIDEAARLSQAAWDEVMKVLNEGTIHDIKTRNLSSGNGGRGGRSNSAGGVSSVQQTEMEQNNTRIKSLKEEYVKATDERRQAIEREIAALKKRNEAIQKLYDMAEGKTFEAGSLGEIEVVATRSLPPLKQMEEALKALNEQLQNAETPEAYQNILADIKAVEAEMKKFKGENGSKSTPADKLGKFNNDYSKIVGGVNSIVSGIEQMGVEIPKEIQNIFGVLQGISSIMTGITAILTLIQLDTKATAAASVTDALLPFARGGIVPKAAGGFLIPGNDHADNTIIAASSGELILNQAQQNNIASQLQQGGRSSGYTPSYVSGEQIWIALNNFTKRTGRGELVTWR